MRAHRCRRAVGGDLQLDLGDATERGVPARFQFARHKAVGRVGSIVLAEGALSRIAGRLQVAQQRCPNLVLSVGGLRLGGHSRCDRSRLDDLKQGRGDGVVDPQPAEGDAIGSPLSSRPRWQA